MNIKQFLGMIILALVALVSCCSDNKPVIAPAPAKSYMSCATNEGMQSVCSEEHEGSKIWIDTFDVLAIRETFDPKYKFERPSKWQTYCINVAGDQSGGCISGPLLSIPADAQLKAGKDGNLFWHWSQAW
jgi:hypothetical protein